MDKSHLGELEADINLRIQQAALALARLSGAAHQWHRDGRSTGGLTYGEGQLIVLSKVRRLLRRQQSMSSLELTDYLQSEQAKWQAMVSVDPSGEGSARPWVVDYGQGGLDALAVLQHACAENSAAADVARLL